MAPSTEERAAEAKFNEDGNTDDEAVAVVEGGLCGMQVYMLIMVGQEAGGMIWILAYVGYASVHAQLYLPPKYGLYLSFVPPLIYAFIGSSRDIAMGPVAVVSLLLGTLLRDEVEPNTPEYLCLAFTATFFAGVTQAALGFFRLGFLIDFLSHAAIVGFMGGVVVTIALQQLKGLLGNKDLKKRLI